MNDGLIIQPRSKLAPLLPKSVWWQAGFWILAALALAAPILVKAQDDLSVPPDQPFAADGVIPGSTGHSEIHSAGNLLYIPVGPKLSSAEVRSGTQPSRNKAHALIAERLREKKPKPGNAAVPEREGSRLDRVVVFLDENGEPILPDAEEARKKSASAVAGAAIDNELTFTFDSPDHPWSASDIATLQASINTFYPLIKEVYGAPAFSNTMNIRYDPTLTGSDVAGTYSSSTNELTLSELDVDVLVHEIIHAFRDDYILAINTYEEGMTRAAEIEVFSRSGVAHPWDDKHSYAYDRYYEGLNLPIIGSKNGNVWAGYVSALVRYQLAGYAWAKALLENSSFFINFNTLLYSAAAADHGVVANLAALTGLAASVQANVEGKPFQTWYAQQGVFDADPPQGYLLYQRINQGNIDYFYRSTSGTETMQAGKTIEWQDYDYRDALLLSGSEVTNSYGVAGVGWPGNYQDKLRIEARTQSPAGPVADSGMLSLGSGVGVFGYLPASNAGSVTMTSLDNIVSPVTVNVVNGAFAEDTLGTVRGRFRADFTDATHSFSVYFNKDASPYFLPMAFWIQGKVTDSAGAPLPGVTLTLSGTSVTTATSGPDGKFFFPHLEGDQSYTITPTMTGLTFSPASTALTLMDKTGNVNFSSQTDTTKPTGTISINNGAASTTTTAVTLTLSATDTGSGVSTMRFSNDNVTWGSWLTFATTASHTLTSGDGTKTVYAQFRDAALNVSDTVSDSITLQAAAIPAAPKTLTAVIGSGNQVNLSWSDQSTNETGFKIERCLGRFCSNFSQIGAVGQNVTGWTDTTVTAGSTYRYRVRAYNTTGNSAYSNIAGITVTASLPAAPSNLTATAQSTTQIKLTWTDNATNETQFKIERCQGSTCSNFVQIKAVGANSTNYTDSNLRSKTAYRYRVRASNNSGNSAYSNSAGATTK
ncbi:fibronectin type III domain-containing protein [Methylosarcina fibrata]|uniref:fibronectin type III domain-containing protein n=1 Tax=Methylosarcina fibrata TaxID=105972 RepID=UPI00035FCF84|nr:carboxypeptidase regulatory-like domain-containing protein [Methylosarcina fibrata]